VPQVFADFKVMWGNVGTWVDKIAGAFGSIKAWLSSAFQEIKKWKDEFVAQVRIDLSFLVLRSGKMSLWLR
jgi:hypothetical protein